MSFLWRFPWRLQLQLQKGGARGYNGLTTSSNDDVNFFHTDIHGLSEEVSLPYANVNHTSKEYTFTECNIKDDIRQACHGESDQKSWLRTFATKSGHAEQKCATADLDTDRIQEIRKIPNYTVNNNLFRIFAVDIDGNINGINYVKSFKWVK